MNFLKCVRNIEFLNKIFRITIKFSQKYLCLIRNRWPVYGTVGLIFEDVELKMYSEGDDHIINCLYYDFEYDEKFDLSLFLMFSKSSNVILDIGANTGLYSCLLGKVNPLARIYAFEPYSVNLNRLNFNINLNKCTNVKVFNLAVGESSRVVEFAIPADQKISDTSSANIDFSKSSYNAELSWKITTVNQISLMDWAKTNNIQNVCLIKIDVEGYEAEVFKGAINLFENSKPIILCEIVNKEESRLFFENFMSTYGYFCYLSSAIGLLSCGQKLPNDIPGRNFFFLPFFGSKEFYTTETVHILKDEFMYSKTVL